MEKRVKWVKTLNIKSVKIELNLKHCAIYYYHSLGLTQTEIEGKGFSPGEVSRAFQNFGLFKTKKFPLKRKL